MGRRGGFSGPDRRDQHSERLVRGDVAGAARLDPGRNSWLSTATGSARGSKSLPLHCQGRRQICRHRRRVGPCQDPPDEYMMRLAEEFSIRLDEKQGGLPDARTPAGDPRIRPYAPSPADVQPRDRPAGIPLLKRKSRPEACFFQMNSRISIPATWRPHRYFQGVGPAKLLLHVGHDTHLRGLVGLQADGHRGTVGFAELIALCGDEVQNIRVDL